MLWANYNLGILPGHHTCETEDIVFKGREDPGLTSYDWKEVPVQLSGKDGATRTCIASEHTVPAQEQNECSEGRREQSRQAAWKRQV